MVRPLPDEQHIGLDQIRYVSRTLNCVLHAEERPRYVFQAGKLVSKLCSALWLEAKVFRRLCR